jgi:hypothetical protein
MTDSTGDPTPREREALAGLPREAVPPPGLEDATVTALRARGLLGGRPARRRRVVTTIAGLAAAAALFAGGVLVGRRSEPPPAAATSRFLLLLYEGPQYRQPPAGEEAGRVREYAAWAGERAAREELVAGEKLRDAGEVVVRRDGTSSPPVAGAERLAGYFVVRAATAGGAVEIARSCPHLRYGGSIVIREIDPT